MPFKIIQEKNNQRLEKAINDFELELLKDIDYSDIHSKPMEIREFQYRVTQNGPVMIIYYG